MMKHIDLNDLKNYQTSSVITLGFFDGMHIGHQEIFKVVKVRGRYNRWREYNELISSVSR